MRDGLHVRSPVRFDGVTVGEDARQQYEDDLDPARAGAAGARGKKERRTEGKAQQDGDQREDAERAGSDSDDPRPAPSAARPCRRRASSPKPTSWTSSSSRATTTSPAANSSKARTCCGSSTTRRRCSTTTTSDKRRTAQKEEAVEQKRDRTQRRAGAKGRRGHRAADEQDGAGHALGRSRPSIRSSSTPSTTSGWTSCPAAGWCKVDDIRASMTMGQPFPGVWLPREMNIHAGITLATARSRRLRAAFADYRQAEVKTHDPDSEARPPTRHPSQERGRPRRFSLQLERSAIRPSEPVRCASTQAGPAHAAGGHRRNPHPRQCVPDATKRSSSLPGLSVGQPLAADGVEAIEKRLKDSGRFETVEVRKRYRSLDQHDRRRARAASCTRSRASRSATAASVPGAPGRSWPRRARAS